jgi:hypothetical protein
MNRRNFILLIKFGLPESEEEEATSFDFVYRSQRVLLPIEPEGQIYIIQHTRIRQKMSSFIGMEK